MFWGVQGEYLDGNERVGILTYKLLGPVPKTSGLSYHQDLVKTGDKHVIMGNSNLQTITVTFDRESFTRLQMSYQSTGIANIVAMNF